MRSFRHFLVVVTAVALLMILAASSALGAETKAKSLHLVKNCATFATASTCVITSSSLKILRGSTLHYLEPENLTGKGTPMLLTTANTLRSSPVSDRAHAATRSRAQACGQRKRLLTEEPILFPPRPVVPTD